MDLKGKKILVTGADGFIGSHLTEILLSRGYDVRALSLYNSFNNWGWLEDFDGGKNLEVVCGDIRDQSFCRTLVKDTEVIFNLAALIAIPYSYSNPESYVDTNVKGTLNLCLAARESGCKKFIQTSTSEVYGTALTVPIDEKHPLQPQSPYSASKIASDAMAMSCYHSFGLPVTIARPFNTYGPRQSARAVIPTIISQIAAGTKSVSIGDSRPTRDFNFVSDTCEAIIAIGQSDETIGEVINIGSNAEISIGDTFQLICEIMQSDAKIQVDKNRIRPEKSEVQRLWCNNEKLIRLTGCRPKVSFKDGLTTTIDWFRNPINLAKYKTNLYNV